MSTTRGDLVPARIYKTNEQGTAILNPIINCMFNPFEYTVSKTNSYGEEARNQSDSPSVNFKKAGPQTLKLALVFDTYETGADVSLETSRLWNFMSPTEAVTADNTDKKEPPRVAFEWGVFRFAAVITNMTHKFTLFKKDGTPVRAKVDITFTQYNDIDDYKNRPQNPTSGGGPIMQTWQVIRGDRLDNIAANVYGDATKWRLIAEYNQMDNPLVLRPGQFITIPMKT
jgi:hypothetical protein